MESILFLSEKDIAKVLTPADVIDTVEQVFSSVGKGTIIPGANSFIPAVASPNKFIAMPVWMPDAEVLGVKWIGTYQKPAPGFPFSHGNLILINDMETASPLAIAGATNITTMRTAGGHAVVAAKYLSVNDPKVLSVYGCGAQGKSGIRSFLYQFPSIEEVKIYDPYPAACEAVIEQFGEQVNITVCDSPEEAAKGCQLMLVVTSSHDILVKADWIEPGTTVLGLNAFHDLDPVLVEKADKWVLGVREEDTASILKNPMKSHNIKLAPERITCDLTEIINGKHSGRTSDDEIIVFSHMGMGAFDIACAHLAYKRALEQGIGTKLEL